MCHAKGHNSYIETTLELSALIWFIYYIYVWNLQFLNLLKYYGQSPSIISDLSKSLLSCLSPLVYLSIYIYDRFRPASGFKLVSTPQIYIYWHHYLKSRSALRVFLNRRLFPMLRSMADLLVRARIREYGSDVTGRRFKNVITGHKFENRMPVWEFEKGHRFKNCTLIWVFE